MELLPAICTRMGDLHCCTVYMSMYRISRAMHIPQDFYARPIRRRDPRQEKIARWMATRECRLLPPIVAAVDGGTTTWSAIEFDSGTLLENLFRSRNENLGFGVLALDGGHCYRVLDGRRRVTAVRSLLDGSSKTAAPASFEKKTMTVNLVLPETPEEPAAAWRERCRKLFADLHPKTRGNSAEHAATA